MTHVVLVDANESAFLTIERALKRGYRVSLVEATSELFYRVDDAFIAQMRGRLTRLVHVESTTSVADLRGALATLHAEEHIDALITPTERSVEATAQAAEALGLRFTSASAVSACRHKATTRGILERHGLRSARHRVCSSVEQAALAAAEIGHPVVVKPVSGMDSMFAAVAETPEQTVAAAAAVLQSPTAGGAFAEQLARGALVEEFLSGPLLSVEVAAFNGQHVPFLVCGRSQARSNPCIELGAVVPAELDAHDVAACFDYAVSVCRAVGLDLGVVHIEMVLTPDGPALVEVNPRLMGGVMPRMYGLVTGGSAADIVLDVHLGGAPQGLPRTTFGACSGRKLLPAGSGVVPRGAAAGVRSLVARRGLAFTDYGLVDGAPVVAGRALGRLVACAESHRAANVTADAAVREAETLLGVPLERSLTDSVSQEGALDRA